MPILTLSLPAAPEGVARGSDALTLLEYPETRNQFIDELMEVPSSSARGGSRRALGALLPDTDLPVLFLGRTPRDITY